MSIILFLNKKTMRLFDSIIDFSMSFFVVATSSPNLGFDVFNITIFLFVAASSIRLIVSSINKNALYWSHFLMVILAVILTFFGYWWDCQIIEAAIHEHRVVNGQINPLSEISIYGDIFSKKGNFILQGMLAVMVMIISLFLRKNK